MAGGGYAFIRLRKLIKALRYCNKKLQFSFDKEKYKPRPLVCAFTARLIKDTSAKFFAGVFFSA